MKNKIIKLVKQKHHAHDFKYHILPTVKNALLLAKRLKADLEVVEVAAYLHDIGRAWTLKEFESKSKENEHHIIGAKRAKEILKNYGYNQEFIKKIKYCVLTHRGRKGPKPETLEAKIIACADAMSHFDAFLAVFYIFLKSNKTFDHAVEEIEQKMIRNWQNKLIIPEAKKIIKEKYKAVMLIIKSLKNT